MRRPTERERRRAIAAIHRLADKAIRRALQRALAPTIAKLRHRHLALTAAATDDLGGFNDAWANAVDEELKPMLVTAFGLGTLGAARQLGKRHAAAVAEARDAAHRVNVEDFVSEVQTRWVRGTDAAWATLGVAAWAKARQELLDGIGKGETVDELAGRLTAMADVGGTFAGAAARNLAVDAARTGSVTEVKALGPDGPQGKRWDAILDSHTRESHARAHGQVRLIDDPFEVGDDLLMWPGDDVGSEEETAGCRCDVSFVDAVDETEANATEDSTMPIDEMAAAAVTAAAEQHTGGMVALVPTEADAQRLAVDGYEPADVLHATLAFLGDGAALPDVTRTEVLAIARRLAAETAPIIANAHGVALFNAASDEPCACYLVGDTDLIGPNGVPPIMDIHDQLWAELEDYGSEGFPEQHSPYVAHLAISYSDDLSLLTEAGSDVTFDRLRVAFGDEVTDFPLAAGNTVPEAEEESMTITDEQATHIGEKVGASLVNALGLAHAPSTTNNTTGTVMLAVGDAPEAPAEMPAPEATAPEDEAAAPEEFHILMVTEEQATLEKPARFFVAQCFDWREPPFPLMWLATDSHSDGDPDPSVQVGLITRVERQGLEIHGWGTWDDPVNEDAAEARRRVENGMLRWNSVDVGDVGEVDIELVFPPAGTVAPDGFEVMEPEMIKFHHGHLTKSTLVFDPAQENAQIEPLIMADGMEPEPGDLMPEQDMALVAAAYAVTIPDVPDDDWFAKPPRELLRRGCLTITDEGRVYGLLAPGAVPHVGRSDRVTVPLRNVDYKDFLIGETPVRLADGSVGRRVTGNLTMACGHASPTLPNGATVSHYDNSCSLFATANCGEADGDVWVAGALLLGVEPDQVRRAMACTLSGHWNPHELARGRYSLLAGLLVPIPGFPKGRTEATATTRWGPNDAGDLMLVASAVPVVFEQTAPPPVPLTAAAERIAKSVGLDRKTRAKALAARVKGA